MCSMQMGVLFDMDGVLIDSLDAHWRSWEISCQERKIPLTRPQYEDLFGSSFGHFVEILSPGMPEEERLRWYNQKEETYRRMISSNFPEMPGASALIQRLKLDGFRIGVASSGPRGNVDLLLENLGAGALVEASCSATEVKRGKPEPDVFLTCAAMLGIHPTLCIVIEDSLPGLQAAKAAGMPAIALVGTRTRQELEPVAACVVDHLDEVIPALLREHVRKHTWG
jgi:beta-phosphoglucomutase